MASLGRRGFLSLLGGGVVGVALADALPRWLVYEPTKLLKAGPSEAKLEALTAAVLKEFERAYGQPSICMPELSRMGETAMVYGQPRFVGSGELYNPARPVMLDQMWSVDVLPIPCEEADSFDKYVRPAAEHLAICAKQDGLNLFGALPLPVSNELGAAVARSTSAAVRGLSQYRAETDEMVLRFDILGGHA